MLLQKEKQSIEEIGKKDKKIYERRKVSQAIFTIFYSPKRVGNIFGQMQKNILEKFLL